MFRTPVSLAPDHLDTRVGRGTAVGGSALTPDYLDTCQVLVTALRVRKYLLSPCVHIAILQMLSQIV